MSPSGTIALDADGAEIIERVELTDDGTGEDDDSDGDHSNQLLTLSTGIEYDDGILDITIAVNETDLTKTQPTSTYTQSNVALALVGPGVCTKKGYAFSFSVRCDADASRNVDGILRGHVNRAPCGANGGGVSRKRKAIAME
jgi:hypothetical protein